MTIATEDLQSLCAQGQAQLMETKYLDAITTLSRAERMAWDTEDFDTLSRLYYPLQEAHRQRRQLCGEGVVRMDLVATSATDTSVDAEKVVTQFPHGQLLVAGWASVAPALAVRRLAAERSLYLETYLAAVYSIVGGQLAVVIVPLDDVALPDARQRSIDELLAAVPPHSIVKNVSDLPTGARRGSPATFAETMALWEQLHAPFLATADQTPDLQQKMLAYQKTIRVDAACELAHQRLAMTARELDRRRRNKGTQP